MNFVRKGCACSPAAAIAKVARDPNGLDLVVQRGFEKDLQIFLAATRCVCTVKDIAAISIGIEDGRQAYVS